MSEIVGVAKRENTQLSLGRYLLTWRTRIHFASSRSALLTVADVTIGTGSAPETIYRVLTSDPWKSVFDGSNVRLLHCYFQNGSEWHRKDLNVSQVEDIEETS